MTPIPTRRPVRRHHRGPATFAVNAGCAAIAAAAVLDVLDWPAWAALLACLPLAAVAVAHRRGGDFMTRMFRVACWLFAGLWSLATVAFGWSVIGVVILAGAVIFGAMLAPAFARID